VINYSLSYLFFTFVQNFKPKKMWMFSITLSHFERTTWIFVYDGCHNHFWKISFIFNFGGYQLVTKSLRGWVHIWGGGKENKMSKYECECFPTKLRWIISPRFQGVKSLEGTILYNDSQHDIPALQRQGQ
jgi:hypothetical protein